MKKYRYSKFMSFVAILCVVTMLFASCGNSITTRTVKGIFNSIVAEYSGDEFHKSDMNNYSVIAKSGLIELLFDAQTVTPAIRDTNSGNVWTALPLNSVDKEINSSAVEITLSDGSENVYTLNSQDNAVNWGNVSYTAGDDGVSVKYSIAIDEATGKADINTLTDGQIRADLTLLYTLRDGSFYVNLSMNTVALPEGVYLEEIRLLNHFGAYDESGEDDYIFVPDGSGALIMTGIEDSEFTPLTLSVYGEDSATVHNAQRSQCLVGAFGIKRSNGAFLCIIENGDSIAEINATRNSEKSLNSVGAIFKTTDILTEESGNKTKKVFGYEYKNEITLCYRFLSGKSATYSGMATACRENLIRKSVLSSKTVNVTEEYLPLVVSLQGGYINNKGHYNVLSNFEQTLSLMTLLKAKGVNNVYLQYNGIYENANNGTNAVFGEFEKELGNAEQYNELYSYINSQKFSLFVDTDILTYKNTPSGALKVDGAKIKNESETSFPDFTTAQSHLKMSKLENKIEDILTLSTDVNFNGYSLNDVGTYLYSDYSSDFYSRNTSQKEISAQMPVLATSKLMMIETGNFYSIKSANVISEIPVSALASPERPAYVSVPFIQLMLHGFIEYSATGINTSDNPRTAFLKAIEYGCLPSSSWYCTKFSEDLDGKYYYDNNINDMVSFYLKANDTLGDLRDQRMTAHYEEMDGVFCTEYNNSTKVYVNFTESAVTINGVTVPAMDCVKIS